MSIFARLERRVRQEVLFAMVAATVIGFASGVTGALVADAYLLPEPTVVAVTGPTTRPVIVDPSLPDFNKLSRSVATFFAGSTTAGVRAFGPDDVISGGGVVTSGGWLVTADSVSAPLTKGSSVAVIDNRSYPIADLARDDYSGLVFVRLSGAENLQSAWIDGAASYASGTALFGFRAGREPQRLDSLGLADRQYGLSVFGARSSETVQKVLRLSGVDGLPVGSLLVDRRGAAVAVLAGRDAWGWYGIPCSAFYGQLDEVFRDQGHIARPYLGLTYLDLANAVSPVGSDSRTRGAMLVNVDGRRAAAAGSPAALAGLKVGDVIVAVDGEELTTDRGLADLLMEYQPGTAVRLVAERGDRTNEGAWPRIEVEVTLHDNAK